MDPLVAPIAQVFGGVTVGAYFVYHLAGQWRDRRNGGSRDQQALDAIHTALQDLATEVKGLRSDLGKAIDQNNDAHRQSGEALAVLRDRR